MSTPEYHLSTEYTSQPEDDLNTRRMEISRIQVQQMPARAFIIPWDNNPGRIKRAVDVVNQQLHEWGKTKRYNPAQLPNGVWATTATQLQEEDPEFFGKGIVKPRILTDRIKEKIMTLKELYRFWIYWLGKKDKKIDLIEEVTSFFQKPRPRNFHQKVKRVLANGFSPVYEHAIADFILATTVTDNKPAGSLMLLTNEPHNRAKREHLWEEMSEVGTKKRTRMNHEEPSIYHSRENNENMQYAQLSSNSWRSQASSDSRFDLHQLYPLMEPYIRTDVREGILGMAAKESNKLQSIAENTALLENWVRRTAKTLFPDKSIRLGYGTQLVEPISP